MNIANALKVALPELPERAIQRSVPKLDPKVIAKEQIEHGKPIVLAKLPGAEAVMQRAATESDSAGLMAGAMGGVMGAGMRMMSAGLSMGQVQSVTRAVIAYTREKAGEDAVGEIVAAVPGLSQFV